uniref:Uncharacterized protein n=1 Tax=Anguilla anguilla TaxID=7936 RepID=A0A0E9P5X2_ANGAN
MAHLICYLGILLALIAGHLGDSSRHCIGF